MNNPPNTLVRKTLNACRRIYTRCAGKTIYNSLQYETDPDVAGEHIYQLLMSDKPCMIARFGANELTTVFNYLGIKEHKGDAWGYITHKNGSWWWNPQILWQMEHVAGFFPLQEEYINHFCELMLEDTPLVDILGSWLKEETAVSHLLKNTYKVALPNLEPWLEKNPWSRALKDKRILVIHPFKEQIEQQYKKRELLFDNKEVLPSFKELHVIKAVQSYGGDSHTCKFDHWFSALQWMENEMDKIDYDICILGCGAYGFPLAAYAKRQGKKSIHLGGVTQLLFGITGNRWLDPNYGVKRWGAPQNFYAHLANQHWIRPDVSTQPQNVSDVENSCYW